MQELLTKAKRKYSKKDAPIMMYEKLRNAGEVQMEG
jgi:hypothetical protein